MYIYAGFVSVSNLLLLTIHTYIYAHIHIYYVCINVHICRFCVRL